MLETSILIAAQAGDEWHARPASLSSRAMLPLGKTAESTFAPVAHWTGRRLSEAASISAVLASIEAEGCRLEHISAVFRPVASTSPHKFLTSGQEEAILGEILGIYVVRPDVDEHGELGAPGEAGVREPPVDPTHRVKAPLTRALGSGR